MRIEFCSLCDESVPLPDLDKGIAVKTKGRIICASCEAAMGGGTSETKPGVGELASAPLSVGGDTTIMEEASPRLRERGKRSGPGDALGGMMFAAFTFVVIGVVMAGFQFYDQYKSDRTRSGAEITRLRRLVEENTAIQERRVRSAVQEATAGLPATLASIDELKLALGHWQDSQTAERAGLQKELDLIKTKLGSLDLLAERMDGNEGDLGKLATSMADIFDDVLSLQRRVDSTEAIQAAAPVELAVVDAPPAEAPWLSQVSGLSSGDPGTRWLAVTAIGEFGDPECAPHLIPRLKDEDVFVRMATARILGEVGANSAIGDLIDTLDDEQNTVRQAAMLALRALTGESLKFDADEKPAVRQKRVKAWRDWWKKNQSKFVTT